ncbi:MAG TPA: mechanosensitive ion channel family protein [Thermoplasmata archaeon]|jgi:small conductance mechanosensitive channel|nr:mechanosensitive ion channel family protein [Thermoplasmata archaeon]
MADDEADGGNLRLGSRLLAILAIGVAAYLGLLFVSRHFGVIDPLYWKALDIGAAIVVGYFAAVLFGSAIRIYLKRVGNLAHSAAIRFITNVVIAMVVVAAVLSLFNVSLSSLLLSSAFAGIVIGLAAQTVLANVFAGFLIILATPFHVGDRIAVVSANYGALAPSYPHEMAYPTYIGTVRAIGLSYTRLRLDNGRVAEFPNQVLVSALILNLSHPSPRMYRVRMTLDVRIPVAMVEAALAEHTKAHAPIPGVPEPRVEVADIGLTTWDAVVVIWSNDPDESPVRDAILRRVLPNVQSAAVAPAAKA